MVKDKWKSKAMLHKFPSQLDKKYVDVEPSFEWMKHSGLKAEFEGLITAVKNHTLKTRFYNKHIIKQGATDRCRMYHTQPGPDTSSRYVPEQAQPSSYLAAPRHIQTLWHQRGYAKLVTTQSRMSNGE